MAQSPFGEPKGLFTYQLHKDELGRVFDVAFAGQVSRGRLIVQSVILALVGGVSLFDFITADPRRGMSLFVVIASLVIGVGQWLVMPLLRRSTVNRQLAEAPTLQVTLYEDYIGFGADEELVFSLDSCGVAAAPDLLVMRVNREFVGIPTRVVGEDTRLWLIEKTEEIKM